MKPSIHSICLCLSLVLSAALVPTACLAQSEDSEVENSFRRISPAEQAQLQQTLAQPTPQGLNEKELLEHLRTKLAAARRLGNQTQLENILRDMAAMTKDAAARNDLAYFEFERGNFDAGNQWMEEAKNLAANPPVKQVFASRIARNYANQYKDALARSMVDEIRKETTQLQRSAKQEWQSRNLNRALSILSGTELILANHKGDPKAALTAAIEQQRLARENLRLLTQANARDHVLYHQDLVGATKDVMTAQRMLGQLSAAEISLAELFRITKEFELPPLYRSGNYHNAALLRFAQREFVTSEKLMRTSDQIAEEYGLPPLHPSRVGKADNIALNLMGQKRWREAVQVFDTLDTKATTEIEKKRILLRYDRAMAYVNNGRYAEAANLFDQQAKNYSSSYPANHFFRAQSLGMKGVALWRQNTPESRAQATELLANSVRDYMLPANADYLENIGIRGMVRETIFATFLETIASTSAQNASQAGMIGFSAADWLRNSSVQESLGDAALRSSVNDPATADLVRKEQDAKQEINALRGFLTGEAGAGNSTLPEIAAKMRARIAELETERSKLQAQIKAQFPDYDRLVRPGAVQTSQIHTRLANNEAFVSILPTGSGTYVWAFSKDKSTFHHSKLGSDSVAEMVKRIRATLDVAGQPNMPAFDAANSAKLYDELVRPLSTLLAGKTHVIVATSGALGQIPMGVLLSATQAAPQNYWISQAAITHVPSATAWLAVKRASDGKQATEPFLGIGDPVFSTKFLAKADSAQNATRGAVKKIHVTRAAAASDVENPAAVSAVTYSMLSPLPETRDEIKAIASVLKANPQQDVLFGDMANKTEVLKLNKDGRLQTKRVLSFATHGLMAGDLPNLTQPALALSVPRGFDERDSDPANVGKPLLTLEDVLGLKLNADWVVLSACNTAAADGKGEEALSGLARGFFYAGAKSILATHWAVDSDSAAELTTKTFSHYSTNPQAPKAESLRQAMLGVMNDTKNKTWAHPAYWAPFALVGDGGR